MNTLLKLWHARRLPIRDGLYTSSGDAYSVQLNDAAPGGVEILDNFDLDSVLSADPDWVTSIDITREVEIKGGVGRLLAGEGSHGSEGFFARIDDDNDLKWVVYLEESNPFVDIAVDGNRATFYSSSGVSITVDIDRPETGISGSGK